MEALILVAGHNGPMTERRVRVRPGDIGIVNDHHPQGMTLLMNPAIAIRGSVGDEVLASR
jgi:hypothetical protein